MFTYYQLQWSSGRWGGYPQIGFNAGDQVNYFKLNESFTAAVVRVVNQTNVGVRGQFVFHTTGNISDVECDSLEGLQVMPFRGSMFGGYEFRLSGICFNESNYTIEIDEQEIQGCQVTLSYIICIMPMSYGGRLKISVYSDNRSIAETDFLAFEPEHNADIILSNYDDLDKTVQSTDDEEFVLQFQSNEITNKYLFRIIIYSYGAQQYIENTTIYNKTMGRADLGLGAMNLSSLQTLTIQYDSIFPIADQPADRAYSLSISFEVDRSSLQLRKLAFSSLSLRIFAISIKAYINFCPVWAALQPDPQTYIDQIPPCPCRVLTTWSENQMGYTADGACKGPTPKTKPCYFHPGATGCYRRPSSTGNAGAQCCYDERGLWISDTNKGAGTLDAFSPDKFIGAQVIHFFYDFLPYLSCCKLPGSSSKENCQKYMDKRPPGRCENLLPAPAGGNGDPHFTTLNGSAYTFNGYGEYTLIKSKVEEFEVQVRLAPVNENSSNISENNATSIIAFVIKNGNQSRVQFELFPVQKLLEILVDDRTVEYTPMTEDDFKYMSTSRLIYSDDHQFRIQQINVTTFEIIYGENNMQFTVDVRSSFDFLNLVSIIPRDTMEKGNPQGLIGDLDGLVFPNGTRIPLEEMNDDRAVFSYGESWRTTNETSFFYYYYQTSHATHQNINYRPIFSQELFEKYNGTDRFAMAIENCRTFNDSERCVYDVLITNDPTISNMHKQFEANMGIWNTYVEEVEEDIKNNASTLPPFSTSTLHPSSSSTSRPSSSSKVNVNNIIAFLIGWIWLLMIISYN